jgi:hypothetical protein
LGGRPPPGGPYRVMAQDGWHQAKDEEKKKARPPLQGKNWLQRLVTVL